MAHEGPLKETARDSRKIPGGHELECGSEASRGLTRAERARLDAALHARERTPPIRFDLEDIEAALARVEEARLQAERASVAIEEARARAEAAQLQAHRLMQERIGDERADEPPSAEDNHPAPSLTCQAESVGPDS